MTSKHYVDMKYESFDELPKWAKDAIVKIHPNDFEQWIYTRVPALDNQSVIDVINDSENGTAKLKKYFQQVEGKFFC